MDKDQILQTEGFLYSFSSIQSEGTMNGASVWGVKSSKITSMTWAAGWGPRPGWGCWGAASTQWRGAGWPAAGQSSSHCASHSAPVCGSQNNLCTILFMILACLTPPSLHQGYQAPTSRAYWGRTRCGPFVKICLLNCLVLFWGC